MAINEFSFTPFGDGKPHFYIGSAVPTGGTYLAGDILFSTAPASDGIALWVCTTGGTTGGTWTAIPALATATLAGVLAGVAALPAAALTFITLSQAQLTTTATSGTLSTAYSMILLNPASTGTYSLPNVTAYAAGAQLLIKNIASGSTTLTPLAANNYEATSIAAITMAQNAKVTLRSAGGTTWYLA